MAGYIMFLILSALDSVACEALLLAVSPTTTFGVQSHLFLTRVLHIPAFEQSVSHI